MLPPSMAIWWRTLVPSLWLFGASAVWLTRHLSSRPQPKPTQRHELPLTLMLAMGTLAVTVALWWPSQPMRTSLWAAMPIVLLAPIAEELYFRGALFFELWHNDGPIAALIVSTVLFALLHVPQGLSVVMIMALVGAALGLITWHTRSLLWPMALHVAWNSAAMARLLPPGRDRWVLVGCGLLLMTGLGARALWQAGRSKEHHE